VVERQYTVSTRKLVDTQDEQELLEAILEETKPAFPAEPTHLHYCSPSTSQSGWLAETSWAQSSGGLPRSSIFPNMA